MQIIQWTVSMTLLFSHFIDEGTEGLRNYNTSTIAHTYYMVEPEFKPKSDQPKPIFYPQTP